MANAVVCDPLQLTNGETRLPPADSSPPLLLGERVVWIHDVSGPEHGTVRWMGKLLELGPDWAAGVELDNPVGKHDGRWAGKQLFITKPKHGLIIPVMGLIKEEEFIGHPQNSESSSPSQTVRGLPPDPPGWYDNVEYHNAHRTKRDSHFWKRLRNKKNTKAESKKRQPQSETAALQVAASIAAGDVPTAITPRSRAKTQTVRSDMGVELDKWYDSADFAGARERKKKSNTLTASSSMGSFGETEVSSLASYGTGGEEGSGKSKNGFLSFFRWFRPKKSSKKKPETPYLASPSLSEGSRMKSSSVHSVTSTSSSFQYVAMDFSQSRSVSNAPTLEAKSSKSLKRLGNKKQSSDEKQRNTGMKSVVNELRVKLTSSKDNASKNTNIDKTAPDEVKPALKEASVSDLVEGDAGLLSSDEILADADYANVSPPSKARGVYVRRKKRRAPPPPPILKGPDGDAIKLTTACPSPKRIAHVKGKRRAPSPPLQSTPKPWARHKDGNKNASTASAAIDVKEKATSAVDNTVIQNTLEVKENPTPSIHLPKTVDAETNTTLFRPIEKPTTVAVSTNTTLIRPQVETAVVPKDVIDNVSCSSPVSSKSPLSALEEAELNDDIAFCDEDDEDISAVESIGEADDAGTKGDSGSCTTCGCRLRSTPGNNQYSAPHALCLTCSNIVPINNPTEKHLLTNLPSLGVSNDGDGAPRDGDESKASNPLVTDEWKEAPRSAQNLISMFNAMSYCFEADKWHIPGSPEQVTDEAEKSSRNKNAGGCSAISRNVTAATIMDGAEKSPTDTNIGGCSPASRRFAATKVVDGSEKSPRDTNIGGCSPASRRFAATTTVDEVEKSTRDKSVDSSSAVSRNLAAATNGGEAEKSPRDKSVGSSSAVSRNLTATTNIGKAEKSPRDKSIGSSSAVSRNLTATTISGEAEKLPKDKSIGSSSSVSRNLTATTNSGEAEKSPRDKGVGSSSAVSRNLAATTIVGEAEKIPRDKSAASSSAVSRNLAATAIVNEAEKLPRDKSAVSSSAVSRNLAATTIVGEAVKSQRDKFVGSSSSSRNSAAATIIEELDDEKWLANVDAEFARLSDGYLQTADRDSKGGSTHEMTFSEICSSSSSNVITPEPSTILSPAQSAESVASNNEDNISEKMLGNHNFGDNLHDQMLSNPQVHGSDVTPMYGEDLRERVLSDESITEGEQINTWSSADSFQDARDTMTPAMREYAQFERMSSRSGNASEESSSNFKEAETNAWEINNPVYSNIPLSTRVKPTAKPRRAEMLAPNVASNMQSSHRLYQNVFSENTDNRVKGGGTNLNDQDRANCVFNGLYANFPPVVEECTSATPDLIQKQGVTTSAQKTDGYVMYENVDDDWQPQCVSQKERPLAECEMLQEEKRMQSRMKMNRRIFKEAKSQQRSSSQESEQGSIEANHTADGNIYYRGNRSVSASSSSSPILSSASSVSSALNSPPALPRKLGPIRERRRRSHPVPAAIREDGPPKAVKNRSHVRENSGLTTLPTRMPSTTLKSSSSVEENDNSGVLVGSLLLQIGSKDGQSKPGGLSLVTGGSLPRDSGIGVRAPIPLPDKKNRKKNTLLPSACSVVANPPLENGDARVAPCAVAMRRRKERSGPARLNEQRRTVGNHLPANCSSNSPCSVETSDDHEYYNIRVHTGEGCRLQVRRAHTLDNRSASGHHHHHHHPNARGREKKGRLPKSFASVATDSPLGKIKMESRVSDTEREDASKIVTTNNCHSPTPTNTPMPPHPPSSSGCYPVKYHRSLSDPDPISLPQSELMKPGSRLERNIKLSRLPGPAPGKTQPLPVSVVKQAESAVTSKSPLHSKAANVSGAVLGREDPRILSSNTRSPQHKESTESPNTCSPRHKESVDSSRKSENVLHKKDFDVNCPTSDKANKTRECNPSQLPPAGVHGRLTCKLTNKDNPVKSSNKPGVNPSKTVGTCEEIPLNIHADDHVNGHEHRQQNRSTRTVEKIPSPVPSPHFNHSPAALNPKTVSASPRQKPASLANNGLSRSPKMLKAEPKELPAVVARDGFHSSSNAAVIREQAKIAGRLWPASYEILAPELLRLRLKLSGIINGPLEQVFNDDIDTLEVNKLLLQLEVCISEGHVDRAAALARKLAMLKVSCSVIRNKPRVEKGSSEEICLHLFVEDRTSHVGPINLYVNPSMTVGDLKKKIENNFDFPSNLQRWILGKKLASDDNDLLSSFDIRTSGCPVFLYLMTTDVEIANAYKQRLESYLKALEELDFDDEDDDDFSDVDPEVQLINSNATGDHGVIEYIPVEKRNGHHHAESNMERISKRDERMYAGARPKQLVNDLAPENRQNDVKKEEGWNCPACTMFNLPTRPGCEICATARPENYVIPKEYVPKPEEQERLLKERQLELDLEQARERERLENYERLLAIDDMDVVLNDEAFECPVCFTDIDVGEGVRVRDCLHVFCRDCLAHAVEYSETAEVKCPFRDDDYSCPNVLQHREIQALVTQEVYDRHLQKSVATAESQAENSFHCKTANCPAWCYFEDNINEFACQTCGHLNCLTCQAIHEGLNCKQYQEKVQLEAATNDEARKTKEALDEMLKKGQAMRCPKCQVILMKKWGCDWICCSMCKTEICWVTKGPRWGPLGQGDTSGGCRCGVNGVRCHAQCNYCH